MDEDLYTYITFILPCVLFGTPVQAHAFGLVIHVQQKRKPRIEKDGKAFVKGVQGSTRVWSGICLASYPGRMGGEKWPGIMAGHLFQYSMAVFDTFDKTFDKSFDAFEKLFDVFDKPFDAFDKSFDTFDKLFAFDKLFDAFDKGTLSNYFFKN